MKIKGLLLGYGHWLSVLGYSESVVLGLPRYMSEFLIWLKERGVKKLEELSQKQADGFVYYFKNRGNKRLGGGLSISHINKQIWSINMFVSYVRLVRGIELNIHLLLEEKEALKTKKVLSRDEIKMLYRSCGSDLLGIRDRAMLSVYYGCGLRKSEGLRLCVEDVNMNGRLLRVLESKTGRSRFVPMSDVCQKDIGKYVYESRPLLLGEKSKTDSFFVSVRGGSLSGSSLISRLNKLKKASGLVKDFGLHTLRHSIATHLMLGGMRVKDIGLFLGHSSLDSTQIYTHINKVSN